MADTNEVKNERKFIPLIDIGVRLVTDATPKGDVMPLAEALVVCATSLLSRTSFTLEYFGTELARFKPTATECNVDGDPRIVEAIERQFRVLETLLDNVVNGVS